MNPRQDRPSVRSRAALAVGVACLAVVAIAARMPASPNVAQDTVQPPVVPVATDSTIPQPPDSIVIDSTQPITQDPSPVPLPTGTPTWPVDPVTGQTLINGVPVVGRVFVQTKVDGLVKYDGVTSALMGEGSPALPAVVAPTRAPLPATAVRRQRNPMVQATLWALDDKPSAVRNRHFKATTTGESLGQR